MSTKLTDEVSKLPLLLSFYSSPDKRRLDGRQIASLYKAKRQGTVPYILRDSIATLQNDKIELFEISRQAWDDIEGKKRTANAVLFYLFNRNFL